MTKICFLGSSFSKNYYAMVVVLIMLNTSSSGKDKIKENREGGGDFKTRKGFIIVKWNCMNLTWRSIISERGIL